MEKCKNPGEELLNLICCEHTLQEVLDLSARLLGTHVSFSNSAFQHRGRSDGYPQYDIDDRNRYSALHQHDLIDRELFSVMAEKTDHTPFILHGTGARSRWISKAYYAGRHVGHFTAIDDLCPLDQIDTEIIRLCSDACAITYAMENGHKGLSESMSTDSALFESLLHGRFSHGPDFSYAAKLYGFKEHIFYRTLCVLGGQPVDSRTREQLSAHLSTRKTSFCSTNFQSTWAVILGSDADFPYALEPQQTAILERLCNAQGIYMGFSDPFSDILQAKRYYEAALHTARFLQTAHSEQHIAAYDDCKTTLLFRDAKTHIACPTDYCSRHILELAKYDRAHSTNYLETLRHYLLCSCSPQRTGEALYVHKNTVIYRVAQMSKLFALDLSNAQARFDYLLSLRLLEES